MNKIISDLAVFDVTENGLVLRAMAEGVTVEELREKTADDFVVDLDAGFVAPLTSSQ